MKIQTSRQCGLARAKWHRNTAVAPFSRTRYIGTWVAWGASRPFETRIPNGCSCMNRSRTSTLFSANSAGVYTLKFGMPFSTPHRVGSRETIMKFLIGFIVGLLVLPVAGFFYFKMGFAPVATGDGVMPFEAWAARTGLHARLNREMPRSVPMAASAENYCSGRKGLQRSLQGCHGFKGQEQETEVKGNVSHAAAPV